MPYALLDDNRNIFSVVAELTPLMETFNSESVVGYNPPIHDPELTNADPVLPVPVGAIEVSFVLTPIPAEVVNEERRKKRHAAYVAESDPIFFKAQRGEATQQQWLDAVAAIDARYPYIT